jgi:predicted  nucleic acid-binding Zn-ribbon protein
MSKIQAARDLIRQGRKPADAARISGADKSTISRDPECRRLVNLAAAERHALHAEIAKLEQKRAKLGVQIDQLKAKAKGGA